MSTNDYGIKISQVGYNVASAADFQLLFSSGWPQLKIALQNSVTITSDVTQTLVTHNLGYVPLYIPFAVSASGVSTMNPNLGIYTGVDGTTLKYAASGGIFTMPMTIYYYIFIDRLEENFTATTLQTTSQAAASLTQDWGIKISKPGKNISSTDLRDFVVHSGTQATMIDQKVFGAANVLTPTSSTDGIVATHNLGYTPLFFPYIQNTATFGQSSIAGTYGFRGNYAQSVPRVFGDTSRVWIDVTSHADANPRPNASLVIFKDPYSLSYPTRTIAA